jgi:hypothetical protein
MSVVVLAGGAYIVRESACRMGDTAVSKSVVTASEQTGGSRGSVRGTYDLSMAMCSFSCAEKMKYREADLHAQPGILDGQLARCPVSGVVFRADAERPRVELVTGAYVTCCESCAEKLKANPVQFVNL